MSEPNYLGRELFSTFCENVGAAVCVDHHGRSGNGFFLCCMEEHPQVVCCPAFHYFFSYLHVLYKDRQTIPREEAVAFLLNDSYFQYLYQDADGPVYDFLYKIGGEPKRERFDRPLLRAVFQQRMSEFVQLTKRELWQVVYYSLACAYKKEIPALKYAISADSVTLREESPFTGYSGRVIRDLSAIVPDPRLIFLVRDPRAQFASTYHQFVNQYGNPYRAIPGHLCDALANLAGNRYSMDRPPAHFGVLVYMEAAYAVLLRLLADFSGRSLLLKNEDMNLHFPQAMRTVTEYLGLAYLPAWDQNEAYKPQFLGYDWQGTGAYNSRYQACTTGPLANEPQEVSARCAGPNSHTVTRWRSRMPRSVTRFLNHFFYDELNRFRYFTDAETPADASSGTWRVWLPFPGELPTLRWLRQGWALSARELRNRLIYSALLPIYYAYARYRFLVGRKRASHDEARGGSAGVQP